MIVWLRNVPLDLSSVTGGTLSGQECQRAMARRFKLAVTLMKEVSPDCSHAKLECVKHTIFAVRLVQWNILKFERRLFKVGFSQSAPDAKPHDVRDDQYMCRCEYLVLAGRAAHEQA